MAKAEQERAASEEEERRLKAKLTAKRDPAVSLSRVASPAVSGASEQPTKDATPTGEESQDVAMDQADSSTQKPDEPQWLPQLVALFDDVKKIAPPGAIEAIG